MNILQYIINLRQNVAKTMRERSLPGVQGVGVREPPPEAEGEVRHGVPVVHTLLVEPPAGRLSNR